MDIIYVLWESGRVLEQLEGGGRTLRVVGYWEGRGRQGGGGDSVTGVDDGGFKNACAETRGVAGVRLLDMGRTGSARGEMASSSGEEVGDEGGGKEGRDDVGHVGGAKEELPKAEGAEREEKERNRTHDESNTGGAAVSEEDEFQLMRLRVAEIVEEWEQRVENPEHGNPVDDDRDIEMNSAVAEVQRLLQEWQVMRADGAQDQGTISEEELSAFQNLLLSWEKYRHLDLDLLIPKSYIRGPHRDLGSEQNTSKDALTAAREATKRLREAENIPQMDNLCERNISESMSAFLPDGMEDAKPERLDLLWKQLLSENPARGFITAKDERSKAELESEDAAMYSDDQGSSLLSRTVSSITTGGTDNRTSPPTFSEEKSARVVPNISSTWLSLYFLSKTTTVVQVREKLRHLLRPKKDDERTTQFISLRGVQETQEMIEEILLEMNSRVVVKIGGRKLKCKVPIGEHILHAVIYLEPSGLSFTKVTFYRSRDDRGRTPSKEFLSSYNNIAARFLENNQDAS